jgi:threonine/homoserine/homoserine lactone efflux protein
MGQELLSTVLTGLIIGFSVAAPVGPIGVLCIRRTLADGRVVGFVSGLGAATADAAYGCVAAFGLTWVSDLLVEQQLWLRLVGGVFLLSLGIKAFLEKPAEREAGASSASRPPRRNIAGAYASTLGLTITNPTTILSFAAIFAGLGLVEASEGYLSAVVLVVGVFSGSALWWLLLSGAVGLFRAKLSVGGLRWVNRISGTVIATFGVLAISGLG